jgi:hypothetical protein
MKDGMVIFSFFVVMVIILRKRVGDEIINNNNNNNNNNNLFFHQSSRYIKVWLKLHEYIFNSAQLFRLLSLCWGRVGWSPTAS